MNYVPCPWTLIEGVEKLPPGRWLEWRDGRTTEQAYWRDSADHARRQYRWKTQKRNLMCCSTSQFASI